MANEVVIHVKGDASDAEKNIGGLTEKLKAASGDLKKVGAAFLGFGAALTAGLTLSVKAAAEEEAGISRLSQALLNAGVSYDGVRRSLEATIEATQQKTSIADDQQREALQKLVEVTGDYNKSLSLMPLVLDLAAAKGMDFGTASEIVGRVAAGNVTILSRYGIQLKEGATSTEALTALTQKFGGQAEKMGQTVSGQMKLLKANFGDAAEALGTALLPVVIKLTESLNKLVLWFKNLSPEMQKFIAIGTAVTAALSLLVGGFFLFLGMIPSILAGAAALGTAFHLVLGPIGLITLAVTAAIAVGVLLWKNWDTVKWAVLTAVNAILGAVEWFANVHIKAFNAVIRGINAFSLAISFGAIPAIREVSEIHLPRLDTATKKTAESGQKAAENLAGSFKQAAGGMKASLEEIKEANEKRLKEIFEQTDKFGGQLVGAIKSRNERLEAAETGAIQQSIDAIKKGNEAALEAVSRGTDGKMSEYARDRDARINSLEAMKTAFSTAYEYELGKVKEVTNEKIAEYEREARAKLLNILAPGNEHIRQLQAEIAQIDERQSLAGKEERIRADVRRETELMGQVEQTQAKIKKAIILENQALGANNFEEAKKQKDERVKLNGELAKSEADLAELRRRKLLDWTTEQQNARKENLTQGIKNILESQKSVEAAAKEEVRVKKEQAEDELKNKEKALAKSLTLTQENLAKELKVVQETFDSRKELRIKSLKDEAAAQTAALSATLEAVKANYKNLNAEDALQAEARKLMIDKNNSEIIDLLNTYNPKWRDAGRSFAQQLIEGLNSAKDSVWAAVNEMLAAVKQAPSLSLPLAGGGNAPTLPAPFVTPMFGVPVTVHPGTGFTPFQEGGIALRPTLALLAEKGPEAVVPLGRGQDMGFGVTVTIINRGIIGVDDLDRHIFQAIRDGKRRGAFQGVIA